MAKNSVKTLLAAAFVVAAIAGPTTSASPFGAGFHGGGHHGGFHGGHHGGWHGGHHGGHHGGWHGGGHRHRHHHHHHGHWHHFHPGLAIATTIAIGTALSYRPPGCTYTYLDGVRYCYDAYNWYRVDGGSYIVVVKP